MAADNEEGIGALNHVHGLGIIHRDLKADTIVIPVFFNLLLLILVKVCMHVVQRSLC